MHSFHFGPRVLACRFVAMKKRTIQLIAIGFALVAVGLLTGIPRRGEGDPVAPAPVIDRTPPKAKPSPTAEPPAAPAVVQEKPVPNKIVRKTTPVAESTSKPAPTPARNPYHQQWQKAEERFYQLWDKLAEEQDPAQRQRLINEMAQYVRMDTLGTIEWAMELSDAADRRLALEAINKYSLSGIGARIEMDESGLPKIRDTTALSAIDATGLVETGDLLIGMQDENGHVMDFTGLSIHEIVRHLRGKPGTDILLYVERPADGQAESFEVPVTRSMLVIQPPN